MQALYDTNIQKEDLVKFQIRCDQCYGLCCVALYFSKLDGFPQDKCAGKPCHNLCEDYTCKIHEHLLQQNLKGCMSYDCFGAGPQVCAQHKAKPNWNVNDENATNPIFLAFTKMVSVNQTLWYLQLSTYLCVAKPYRETLQSLICEGEQIKQQATLHTHEITSFQTKANRLLKQLTRLLSKTSKQKPSSLIGANLSGKDVAYLNLSMCCMLKANLSHTNLYGVNFLGADTRDVDVRYSDMRNCVYLTQIQLNAMQGNLETQLPAYLQRPAHW